MKEALSPEAEPLEVRAISYRHMQLGSAVLWVCQQRHRASRARADHALHMTGARRQRPGDDALGAQRENALGRDFRPPCQVFCQATAGGLA